MIRKYRVTYDSNDETFILHQEAFALPYMVFRMYKSDHHVFDMEDIKNLVLINTVEEKMKAFTKRDAEGAKEARKLYDKMLYLSHADLKWLIKKQPNQKLQSVSSEYRYRSRDMGKGNQCPEGQDRPRQSYCGSFGSYQDSQRDY